MEDVLARDNQHNAKCLKGGHLGRRSVRRTETTDEQRGSVYRVSGKGEGSVWRSRRCGITIERTNR